MTVVTETSSDRGGDCAFKITRLCSLINGLKCNAEEYLPPLSTRNDANLYIVKKNNSLYLD